MYGKWYAQTYTGSMCGAGLAVFSVWGYVVAHTYAESVELNPILIAAALGCSPEEVSQAIEYLCAPDPQSRTPLEEGRRLVREGQFIYRVPTFNLYRSLRDQRDRREYNRTKKAESRQHVSTRVSTNVSRGQPPSAAVSPLQTTDNIVQKQSKSKDPPAENVSGEIIPPDQPPLNYGIRILDDLGMTDTHANRITLAGAVEALMKQGKS